MSRWTLEIEDDFLIEIQRWPRGHQLELIAIQTALEGGGPEAMGLVKGELEGVPDWRDLSGVYPLRLPVLFGSEWRILTLEVQQNFRIVIVRLE